MALAPGTSLGHYDVTSLLGEGGMGQVWQATDTQLNRQVALKILPDAFADDPDRLARFTREAQILASLNHPNIAQIHGIEESEGTRALVLELVEGPTLADRISKGPIPVDEALPIAKQIAEALEAAHEAGVIHRDLKPANIKVREDGTVKVLDFGLAKALDPTPASDPSESPTLTAAATQMGVILGTAAYMSPEQAAGRTTDRRSDNWSFGVVLFEMLAGERLLDGETVSHVLAKVLDRGPDFTRLPRHTPTPVRRLLRRCLEKDRKGRLGFIGDARLELEDARAEESADQATPGSTSSLWARPTFWSAVAVTAALSVLVTAWAAGPSTPPAVERKVTRFTIPIPEGQEVTSVPSISADGRYIAFTAGRTAEPATLYLRSLEESDPIPVEGSEGARDPFFSPNGRWVAFFADRQLFKAAVTGAAPIPIAAAPYPAGGTWGVNDSIVFVPSLSGGLLTVSADGGTPERLTTPDSGEAGYAHVWPQWVSGASQVLFGIWGGPRASNVLLTIETGDWVSVLPHPTGARYLPGGHLVVGGYETAELQAVAFDPSDPIPTVAQTSILDDVFWYRNDPRSWFDVSRTGTLVYVPGDPAQSELVWVSRNGEVEPLSEGMGLYEGVAVSGDGTRLAFGLGADVWVRDLQRRTTTRVTFEGPANHTFLGAWTPDGRLAFSANRSGTWELYATRVDGTGSLELLLEREFEQHVGYIRVSQRA